MVRCGPTTHSHEQHLPQLPQRLGPLRLWKSLSHQELQVPLFPLSFILVIVLIYLDSSVAVFTSLTHSDQFVPELMQITRGILYQNVTDLWRYTTKTTDVMGITVSGRNQGWLDVDGSASLVSTYKHKHKMKRRGRESRAFSLLFYLFCGPLLLLITFLFRRAYVP